MERQKIKNPKTGRMVFINTKLGKQIQKENKAAIIIQKALKLFKKQSLKKEKFKILQFYSKSKDSDDINCGYKNWRKILSNFHETENGIVYNGHKYKSIEAIYQGMKFEKTNLEYSLLFKNFNSLTAKKMGGKTETKKRKVVFDSTNWNKIALDKMKLCVDMRYNQDPIYKHIISVLSKTNMYILHFSRMDMYWGGKVKDNKVEGQNMLGKIIMKKY